MFGGSGSPSLADIAAVTRNNDGNGFGDGGGWWAWIILFALFGGWGNNGWGNGRNGGSCNSCCQNAYDTQAVVQRGFDNQAVLSKLNAIGDGVCSLGYDQLAQMNGINANITATGNGIVNALTSSTFALQNAINADTVANMQNTNGLSRQLADCCCENRAAIAQVRYDMATDACDIKNAVHQTGDAIIQSQNNGFQMLNQTINDRFTRLEIAQKDQQIAELQAKLNACDRDNALAAQSTYLLGQLNPQPRPSYIVQNPNCCSAVPVVVQSNGCGCGNCNQGLCA